MSEVTNKDDQLARLRYCILYKGYILDSADDLWPFRSMFGELFLAKQMVVQGISIVLAKGLQPEVIALSHEGHQAATKIKWFLRARVRFPNIDNLIERFEASCRACLSLA